MRKILKNVTKKKKTIKVNNIEYIKKQNLNKLLIKDDYLGPIKLAKIKEFNVTKRQKNKIMEKIKQLKNLKKSHSRNNNFYQIEKINNKIENNNNSLNNISSIINVNNINYNNSTTNIHNINSSISNNFDNNSVISLKSAYFLHKNNSIKNDNSMNLNKFITLRDFLTNTVNNLKEINEKIKLFIRKNDTIKNMNYNSYKKIIIKARI